MGQEIKSSKFTMHDFSAFSQRLSVETGLLHDYFQNHRFTSGHEVGGFEVEAWLVDNEALPAPINDKFLTQLHDPMVVHELASFNIELNVMPQTLRGNALQKLHEELTQIWDKSRSTAAGMNADIMAIGVHPGVSEDMLTLKNMSKSLRYRALNEQVIALREGKPLALHIRGRDHMEKTHHDVMLEAGTTSFQIHLQVAEDDAVRAYNASLIASAPLVAASANAPFIFGYDLWDESRIPLFQQAVDIGNQYQKRVTFGHDYVKGSLFSCFTENIEDFPVLIPVLFEENPARLPHLRFHNGTIWRWNRPLIGFNGDDSPHLRIENRVTPAGPATADMIANAALYWGLVQALSRLPEAPEHKIDFTIVRRNFYEAARHSLDASIHWLDGSRYPVRDLLRDQLLPMARQGLVQLGIDEKDCDHYLGIIGGRIATGQNGAAWQRRWAERHGRDMKALSLAYLKHQHTQQPVHTWDLSC